MTWRAEALAERDWELTAWRCYYQPWFSAPESPDVFNKLKLAAQAEAAMRAKRLEEEARKSLPKTLSNAEAQARFNAFVLRTGL